MLYSGMVPYGSLNLTDSSPAQPFTEPLSLTEVKDYLKLPAEVTDQDDALSGMISAARNVAEILQGRDLVRKQLDLSLDYWPCRWSIELRDPLVSVDLLRYRDFNGDYTTMVENTHYIVDAAKHPGVILPAFNTTWPCFTPWPSSAILARFTSGYEVSSPYWNGPGARVKIGMKMLISGWFTNRIPYNPQMLPGVIAELPNAVTFCLTNGSLTQVR